MVVCDEVFCFDCFCVLVIAFVSGSVSLVLNPQLASCVCSCTRVPCCAACFSTSAGTPLYLSANRYFRSIVVTPQSVFP